MEERQMHFVWGFGCIAVVIATSFVLSRSNFLLVDSLYALLAGAAVGVCLLIGSLFNGRDAIAATRLLFFSMAGSLTGFAVGWAIALVLGLRFQGQAALAFDLAVGAVGAAVMAAAVFPRDSSANAQ
jgi:hypothetical protein